MSASASSYRQKTLIHPGFSSCRSGGSTKRQHSAPGQLEERMLRDRAAGPSPSSYQHPPSPAFLPGSLPRSHSSQHHWHTQLTSTHSSVWLTAGIEDTFLDFEIVICKTLPRMTCRGAFPQHFHSVQQFGWKDSRFGKTKGCRAMLAEQRGKFPFSWTWQFSFLSPRALHSLTRFKTHFCSYIPYLPTHRRYSSLVTQEQGFIFLWTPLWRQFPLTYPEN